MEFNVIDINGKETGKSVKLDASVFGIEPNDHSIYLDVRQFLANARQGTHKSKERGEINRTTKKHHKQKGTGGARHASRKAPIFVGGGIAHGPKGELAYKKRKLNKNEKKLSVASLITEKNINKNLLILNDFNSEIKKTKEMNAIIQKLEITHSLIILDKSSKEKIEKSARNIPNVKITDVNHFSSYDIIKFKKVVFTESSVKELEKRYS